MVFARKWHTSCAHGDSLYVYGGIDKTTIERLKAPDFANINIMNQWELILLQGLNRSF